VGGYGHDSITILHYSSHMKTVQLRLVAAFKNMNVLQKKKTMEADKVRQHLTEYSHVAALPGDHVKYLQDLKQSGFEPNVIYDIGACVLHWTNEATKIWPNATFILLDATPQIEFLYKDHNYAYHMGVLSDEDDKMVNFYYNEYSPGGNSYYREISIDHGLHYPEHKYLKLPTKKLDTVIKERNFPLPDFVKIDVQGAELDIIKGGKNTLKHATRLVVELQHMQYNAGAPLAFVSLPIIEKTLDVRCTDPLFCNNGFDGDYGFLHV